MSGRHSARRVRRGRAALLAVLVVAATGGIGYGAYAMTGTGSGSAPAAASRPRTPAVAACTGTVTVPVVVAPEVLSAVRAVAAGWARARPAVRGRCAVAEVSAATPERAVAMLAATSAPTVWVPDSSVWTARLAALRPRTVVAGSSVATSPLVLAVPAVNAAAMRTVAGRGWAAVFGGVSLAIPDPSTNAAGSLMVLAAGAQARTPAQQAQVIGLFLRLSRTTVPGTQLVTRDARAVVTSERAVRAGGGRVVAVFPAGPTPALDYPAVRVVPTGADPTRAAAAAAFTHALMTASARSAYVAAGLRDPSGGGTPRVQLAPSLSAAQQASATRLWRAAVRPAQLLSVTDVSGSMGDPAGGGGPAKITVATRAAQRALQHLPGDWRVGLWTLSSDPDWTQLVPLGAVAANRSRLLAAERSLPGRVGGNTALYTTALAAFDNLRRHYDATRVNVVVLLTDGANVDPGGTLTLRGLVAKLRAGYDARKPVRIVTIGFGRDADLSALRQISAATHGQAYHVSDPAQIETVLLDSILANN